MTSATTADTRRSFLLAFLAWSFATLIVLVSLMLCIQRTPAHDGQTVYMSTSVHAVN